MRVFTKIEESYSSCHGQLSRWLLPSKLGPLHISMYIFQIPYPTRTTELSGSLTTKPQDLVFLSWRKAPSKVIFINSGLFWRTPSYHLFQKLVCSLSALCRVIVMYGSRCVHNRLYRTHMFSSIYIIACEHPTMPKGGLSLSSLFHVLEREYKIFRTTSFTELNSISLAGYVQWTSLSNISSPFCILGSNALHLHQNASRLDNVRQCPYPYVRYSMQGEAIMCQSPKKLFHFWWARKHPYIIPHEGWFINNIGSWLTLLISFHHVPIVHSNMVSWFHWEVPFWIKMSCQNYHPCLVSRE